MPMPTAAVTPDQALISAAKIPDVLEHAVVFKPFCLQGSAFGPCEFENPEAARRFFGPYRLEATFYDAQGRQVTSAQRPGRYAAVVAIHHGDRISRRFLTLCRLGGEWRPAGLLIETILVAAGIDPQMVARHKDELVLPPPDRFVPARSLDAHLAVVAAGFYDLAGSKNAPPDQTLSQMDRQWWVEFKRRFYSLEEKYPVPFAGPRQVVGQPGKMLRDGMAAEAGLKADGSARIDAAAEAWVRDSGIGFALVIARHGIVAKSKAYGPISQGPQKGSPFQVDTLAPLASMTKFFGPIMMLQFVERGLLDFDQPVEKYVPALRGLRCSKPPTVRDLYTHTAGLTGHWGDTLHDMEEYVGDIYPALASGSPHQYHGAGHALGGKIMELISGQAMPGLYRQLLTGPLQCNSMKLERTSYGSWAAVGDLARIGQMMLNGGSYGAHQFFTPPTLAKMMPIPGRDRIGPDPAVRWGIGIKEMDNDGLSPNAFGHSGATGSFLVIDPQRDLVIAHTRFEDGRTYEEFLQRKHVFIASILESLA